MKPTELKGFREKIDAVDDQIVELLAERASYVKEVGKRKKAAKLPEFRPEREVEIIERMCDCLLYTSPSPRDRSLSRMPSSA